MGFRKLACIVAGVCGLWTQPADGASNRDDRASGASEFALLAPSQREEKKRSRFWSRMFRGNIDRTYEKKIDFSFIGAPNYSKEASLGIGFLASGLYRLDRTDSLTAPSDISIFGNVSLSGFYMFGISGNTLFRHNRSRLVYETSFSSKPLDFWGVGYDAGAHNEAGSFTRKQVRLNVSYLHELFTHFYAGASADFTFTKAAKFERPEYLLGFKSHYNAVGLGATLQYDSRDFITGAERGCYVMVRQMVYPKGFGNIDKTLFKTTLTADWYHRLWTGGILALDAFGEFNSKGTPWCMMAELGGGYRMRGYYQGRYLDENMLSCQIELRQHVWRRLGCVLWGGAGNVFPDFRGFEWSHTLPNYGLGLRWEFKHRVNVRIDYGFGRKTSGLVFNINEAF